jgi:hypothetical protein
MEIIQQQLVYRYAKQVLLIIYYLYVFKNVQTEHMVIILQKFAEINVTMVMQMII